MIVELQLQTGKQLQDLAAQQGQDPVTILEAALNHYAELLALSDLEASAVAEGQMKLIGELAALPAWSPAGT